MSKTILIAEDNAENSRFIDSMLIGEGFDIIKCPNALEAVKILKTQNISIVICDETAPKLAGSAIAEIIRKTEGICYTPIILISDDANFRRIAKLLENKVINFFLPRPFSGHQLLNLINVFCKPTSRTAKK